MYFFHCKHSLHSCLWLLELSHISAACCLNFLASSAPNEGRILTTLLPRVFVLRGVPFWPTYVTVTSAKTFVVMATRGVRERCAYLKCWMLLSSYGGSSVRQPTQTAHDIGTSNTPRNLHFGSVSAFSICLKTSLFFCLNDVSVDGRWKR